MQIRFQDLVLKYGHDHQCEVLELVNELVKKRSGEDIEHDTRDVTPKLWASGDPEQCPVIIYNEF